MEVTDEMYNDFSLVRSYCTTSRQMNAFNKVIKLIVNKSHPNDHDNRYQIYCNYYNRHLNTFGIHDLVKTAKEFVSNLPSKLSEVKEFLLEVYKQNKESLVNWIKALKDKTVFQIIKEVGFSLAKLIKEINKVPTMIIKPIMKVITDYALAHNVTKWTDKMLLELDKLISKNKVVKTLGALGLFCLLIWINMHVSYTGDLDFDFDFSAIGSILTGNDFSLLKIFGGEAGLNMIIMFLTNLADLSVPFSGIPQIIMIAGGIALGIYRARQEQLAK